MTDNLDEPIEVGAEHPLRLSADALRSLKKATGRTMTDLLADEDDEVSRFQVLAFAELHRRAARLGHHEPDERVIGQIVEVVDLGGGHTPVPAEGGQVV